MTPFTRSIALAALASAAVLAQPKAAPSFEIASVKVNNVGNGEGPGRGRQSITSDPGILVMKNVSLKSAIQWAYHLYPYEVSGPKSMDEARFDIDAKTGGPTSEEQRRAMLQTLLTERFKLATHKESKELAAYVVTVGKSGVKFKESAAADTGDMDMKPNGRAGITVHRASMTELANMLNEKLSESPLMVYRVIDQTGLKGRYDITIDMSAVVGVTSPVEHNGGGIEDMLNNIIGALAEQTGLKFEIKKTAVDILVVDHAEKLPAEN